MKELIEKKLEDYAHNLVEKEALSCEDVNFLVFMLNRIEIKENQERDKEEREKSNQQWRDKMKTMIEGVM